MKAVGIEAGVLLSLGLALGVVIGLVWGFPSHAAGASDAVCTGPVPSEPQIQWISLAEARAAMDAGSARFVDARSADAYEAGHVTGARHIPIEQGTIEQERLAGLDPAQALIVYCDTNSGCAASKRVAAMLWGHGYYNVRVMEGGMPAWLNANHPAEAGSCHDCN